MCALVPLLFQYRKSCVCAFSSLGARAAAVRAWVLVPVQGLVPLCALGRLGARATAGCRCFVRLGAWMLVAGAAPATSYFFGFIYAFSRAIWGLCWCNLYILDVAPIASHT